MSALQSYAWPGNVRELMNVVSHIITFSEGPDVDVSHLPPPLPMVRILETLRALGPGETLLVHHTRRPIHLYPKLDALGCRHETTEPAPGKIQVRITTPPARPS